MHLLRQLAVVFPYASSSAPHKEDTNDVVARYTSAVFELAPLHDKCDDESAVGLPSPFLVANVPAVLGELPRVEFHVGDYVQLRGLKDANLNGKPGAILELVPTSRRFDVVIAGKRGSMSLAVKPCNLQPYTPKDDEVCEVCEDVLNLFACPPCECGVDSPTTHGQQVLRPMPSGV